MGVMYINVGVLYIPLQHMGVMYINVGVLYISLASDLIADSARCSRAGG